MFDLDGTLVRSEKLKAQSYAIAAQRLLGLPEPDPRAIEAYREIVGAAGDVASRHIMDKLGSWTASAVSPSTTASQPSHANFISRSLFGYWIRSGTCNPSSCMPVSHHQNSLKPPLPKPYKDLATDGSLHH